MLQNYQYFLTLADELSISRAAEKLYISHQNLSRYLKNLEEECGVQLFERKPVFSLTYAGRVMQESLRQVEQTENNLLHQLGDLRNGDTGEIRLGITEGRLRIMIPDILKNFKERYPRVLVKVTSAPSPELRRRLLENKLDMIIVGAGADPNFTPRIAMEEELFLVASDNVLREYFGQDYEEKRKIFSREGASLRDFARVPFALNYKGFNSRDMLDRLAAKQGVQLSVVYEATQPDLLHMMAARDYAASTCLTMYLPGIYDLNAANPPDNQLHIFPIRDMEEKNPVVLLTASGKYLPSYTQQLCRMVEEHCCDYNRFIP